MQTGKGTTPTSLFVRRVHGFPFAELYTMLADLCPFVYIEPFFTDMHYFKRDDGMYGFVLTASKAKVFEDVAGHVVAC